MNIHLNRTLLYVLAWLAAVVVAFVFAVASPNEASVMGHLPSHVSQTLTHRPLTVPGELPSDRTLALVTFQRAHRAQADSWIEGLNLKNDDSINWLRLPVLNDPGTATGRQAAEGRLLQNYPADNERAGVVPIFTNRSEFVRSLNLNGVAQSYAIVVNRRGDVLARVEGQFDAGKAEILRETLQGTKR